MELSDLVGEHYLSGLDTYIEPKEEDYQEDKEAFRFVLDGITYKAVEDPSDGWRSYLGELSVTDEKVQYNFPPQKVIGKMREDEEYSKNDVIEFYDPITNKLVLAVGTDNHDDWYPCCVMVWNPENLAVNS